MSSLLKSNSSPCPVSELSYFSGNISYLLLDALQLTLQLLDHPCQLWNLALVALQVMAEFPSLILQLLKLEARNRTVITFGLWHCQAQTQLASYSPCSGRKHRLLLCSSGQSPGTSTRRSWWCFPCPGLGCCPSWRWPRCRRAGDRPGPFPAGEEGLF